MIGQIFILFSTFFLTGLKNGLYYANQKSANFVVIMFLFLILLLYSFAMNSSYWFIPVGGLLIGQIYVFAYDIHNDIHLTEYLLAFFIRVLFAFGGMDLPLVVLSSLLTDTFFKIPINVALSKNFVEAIDSTDDPNGKYLGVWIRGKEFRVPRLSNGYVRMYLGIAMMGVWYMIYYIYGTITIYDLFRHILN